jgi:hypothetical protein
MSKIIHIINNRFDFFNRKSQCESFIESKNPQSVAEVEKLIGDFMRNN